MLLVCHRLATTAGVIGTPVRGNSNATLVEIQAVRAEMKARHGSPRMHAELVDRGHGCCENTVARIMREAGIAAKMKRKFRQTTDSNHSRPVAENHLDREFNSASANETWVTDITYVSTREGWLCLAVVEDLFSRMMVGWSMSQTMTSRLVVDALEMAVLRRLPGSELVAHSDRGSQYASEHYQRLLSKEGIACSMSRRANCWDNAPMESFFASLKEGAGSSRGLRHSRRCNGEQLRVHRDVLQPGSASLDTGLRVAGQLRSATFLIRLNPVSIFRGELHTWLRRRI